MGRALYIRSRWQSYTAGVDRFEAAAHGFLGAEVTEARQERTYRQAVTLSGMYVNVKVNDRVDASTVRSRKNTANGNQVITIGAGATGDFEDSSNSDSYAAGDIASVSVLSGTGGTELRFRAIIFKADTANTVQKVNAYGNNNNTASVTEFSDLVQRFDWFTPESTFQSTMRLAATAKNFYLHLYLNARSTTTTFGSRKNSAAGGMSVSVGAGATGVFEDTSGTDTLADGDTFGWSTTTGSGTGGIEGLTCACDLETTTQKFPIFSRASTVGFTTNAGVTEYMGLGVGHDRSTTESETLIRARLPMQLSRFTFHIESNGITAATTIRLRKNSGNANQVLTVGSGATGWFEDASSRDNAIATDQFANQIVAGASGTSMVWEQFSVIAQVNAGGRLLANERNHLMRTA